MADETKDGPASEPGPPKMATEGARAETGAAKTDAAPIAERQAAATSETFKAPPSEAAAAEVPAVAGGTNAPAVPPPGPAPSQDDAAAAAKAEKVAAARAAHAAKLAAEGKPAPAPAPAAAAAAAKATATPAATGTAPAPKVAPKAAGDDMSRRGFFSWAAVAWVGFSAAIGGCVTAMGRFMFPNVLFEPPTTFKAGYPQDVGSGVVDTRFVDKYGVWIVNNEGKLYALIAICTHLGCPPAWLETQNKFKCPCHGSGYYKSGVNFEGPTPRPLERARIFISPDDGQIVVDKAQKFQQELGQWEDPNSFISLA